MYKPENSTELTGHTVADLIAALQKFPQTARISCCGDDYVKVYLDTNEEDPDDVPVVNIDYDLHLADPDEDEDDYLGIRMVPDDEEDEDDEEEEDDETEVVHVSPQFDIHFDGYRYIDFTVRDHHYRVDLCEIFVEEGEEITDATFIANGDMFDAADIIEDISCYIMRLEPSDDIDLHQLAEMIEDSVRFDDDDETNYTVVIYEVND